MNRGEITSAEMFLTILAILVVAGIWHYESGLSKLTNIAHPQLRSGGNTSSSAQPPIGVPFISASSSLASYVSSTETYVDPTGTFSFEYPKGFTLSSDTAADFLPTTLVEAQAGFYFIPDVSINVALTYFIVGYASSSDQNTCDHPIATATAISHESINNIDWFEASPPKSIDDHFEWDEYQTFRQGACWGLEFVWLYFNGNQNGAPIRSFEEATLETFRFLNNDHTRTRGM
jgi:hypothetical protein